MKDSKNASDARSGPLERYIRILEVLTAFPSGMTANDLEKVLVLPKTTVNRLLRGLLAAELLHINGRRGGKYFLGDRLTRIMQSDNSWLQTTADRALTRLAKSSGETAFLARRVGNRVQAAAMKSSDAIIRIYVEPGHDLPRHASASGKLLTALHAEIDWDTLSSELNPFTSRTIVNVKKLKLEYALIRKQQYSLDRSEHVEGLASIAVAIDLSSEPEPRFAVGLTGPTDRVLPRAEAELLPLLQRTASELQVALNIQTSASGNKTADPFTKLSQKKSTQKSR